MVPKHRLVPAYLFMLVLFYHTAVASARSRPRKLQFYFNDYVSATNFTTPTSKFVAGPVGAGNSYFGSISVFDNKLTATQDFNSEELGRARGFYVISTLDGLPIKLLHSFTVVFTTAPYNGSALNIFGLKEISMVSPSTLSVIGGTKDFELVAGTAIFETVFSSGLNAVNRVTLKLVFPKYLGEFR